MKTRSKPPSIAYYIKKGKTPEEIYEHFERKRSDGVSRC